MHARLGLNVHRDAWPTAAHEATIMLEVERSHRPALEILAADTTRLLALD